MTEFVCHVGAHKTGTTAIQSALRENRAHLRRFGVGHAHPRDPAVLSTNYPGIAFCFLAHGTAPGAPARARRLFRMLERRMIDLIVVSHEGLLGPHLATTAATHLRRAPLYPFAAEMLGFLRSATDAPMRVVLYIRDQAGFLASVHRQLEATARAPEFDEWLAWIDLDRLSWRPVVEAAVAAFGQERVAVRPFSLPEIGLEAHLAEFMRDVVGIGPPPGSKAWAVRNTNPSFSDTAMLVKRRLQDLPLSEDQQRSLHLFLKREFSTDAEPRADPFQPSMRAGLAERYDDENADLVTSYSGEAAPLRPGPVPRAG